MPTIFCFVRSNFEYECATQEGLAAALICLKEALAIDPSYAAAMALTAYCYAGGSIQGWSDDVAGDAGAGLRLAERALELGKDDSNVLWMAAYAVRRLGRDVQRARKLAYRSVTEAEFGDCYSGCGLDGGGTGELGQGAGTAPSSPTVQSARPSRLVHRVRHGAGPRGRWQFADAAACARIAVDQNPRSTIALRFLAGSLARLGEKEKAARHCKTCSRSSRT